jgi:hypothetical protein
VADFDDAAGYIACRGHPAHRQFAERYLTPALASGAVIQFELPSRG